MKLYTEEEIKETLKSIDLEEAIETFIEFADPIELPSDEEIEKFTDTMFYGEKKYFVKAGALWMKNQILNQNK